MNTKIIDTYTLDIRDKMSKYTVQDPIEEKGINIFRNSLDPNFFLISDFSSIVGKDRVPDIDGQIRLRDGNGRYLNKYFHYQIKSTENLINSKYFCSRCILDYLVSSNVPTLIFVVDIKSENTFWYFLDKNTKRALNLSKDNKGRTLDLSKYVVKNNSIELNQIWQKYAKGDDYQKLSNSLNLIVSDYQMNVVNCVGLLHLLQRVSKSNLPPLFNKILNVDIDEVNLIIKKLHEAEIITSTPNLYLLENEQLGIEALFELLKSLNLTSLVNILDNINDQKLVLRQLSNIDHPAVNKYLSDLSKDIIREIKISNDNDFIFSILDLLEEFVYRVPKNVLTIVKTIIKLKSIPAKPLKKFGSEQFYGNSHDDLVEKCITLMDRIRYMEIKEVFNIAVKLSNYDNQAVSKKAIDILEHISKYNLFVLRNIGLYTQIIILSELEKWKIKKLLDNKDIIFKITKELLEPSFGGESSNYDSITFHSGPLVVSDTLKDIRRRTIKLLQNIYNYSKEIGTKASVLQILQTATYTPHTVSYGEDLEEMVLEDTNAIINFYITILPDAKNEIIQDIEEQKVWFIERFDKSKLCQLKKLENILSSNDDYAMFKVFVGYDGVLDPDNDYEKESQFRSNKIHEYVSDISNSNFTKWRDRLLTVVKNYNYSDPGSYGYFGLFLSELGKNKPNISLRLINENEEEFKPFLLHLLSGLWQSSKQKEIKGIISQWIDNNKHLSECASLFTVVKYVDINLLRKAFKKAKLEGDINAFIQILNSIFTNYKNYPNLKPLFLSTIKELTINNDSSWVDRLWFKRESIISDLSEKEVNIILKNMLYLQNINYHSEEILKPIAEKYPIKIIDFFCKRVKYQLEIKSDNNRYDAVPFKLHQINEILRQHEKVITPKIFEWFRKGGKENNWRYKWDASHLIEEIFPQFSPALESSIIKMIQQGGKRDIEIVFSILSKYKGEEFLWNIVKAIIVKYTGTKQYEEIERRIFGRMTQTGVVSGEDGMVRAYKSKKKNIQHFKSEKNNSIQLFIRDYENHLDKLIEFEQKRTDEEVELMKRGLDR